MPPQRKLLHINGHYRREAAGLLSLNERSTVGSVGRTRDERVAEVLLSIESGFEAGFCGEEDVNELASIKRGSAQSRGLGRYDAGDTKRQSLVRWRVLLRTARSIGGNLDVVKRPSRCRFRCLS